MRRTLNEIIERLRYLYNDEQGKNYWRSQLGIAIQELEALSAQPHDAEGQRILKEIEAKVEAMKFLGYIGLPIIIKDEELISKNQVLAIIREASQSEAQPLTREDKE